MKKLSEAGKLYLNDFYILNEAQKDASDFLDEVLNQTYQRLLENINDLTTPDNFSWGVWKNESRQGRLEFYLTPEEDIKFFRKGKWDLGIIYEDVRHSTSLESPASIEITVYSPVVIKKEIQRLQFVTEEIYSSTCIPLDLEDSNKSVDLISEYMLEKGQQLCLFIQGVTNG